MAKRNIFNELMQGVAAMKSHRENEITLRSYKADENSTELVRPLEPDGSC